MIVTWSMNSTGHHHYCQAIGVFTVKRYIFAPWNVRSLVFQNKFGPCIICPPSVWLTWAYVTGHFRPVLNSFLWEMAKTLKLNGSKNVTVCGNWGFLAENSTFTVNCKKSQGPNPNGMGVRCQGIRWSMLRKLGVWLLWCFDTRCPVMNKKTWEKHCDYSWKI